MKARAPNQKLLFERREASRREAQRRKEEEENRAKAQAAAAAGYMRDEEWDRPFKPSQQQQPDGATTLTPVLEEGYHG